MPKKRKKIDWEAIEREYRAGMLSICEIARQHEISESYIRKKAKEKEWKRDLTERVRERVRTKLAPSRTKEDQEQTEEEAIEHAANQTVTLLRDHQSRIKNIFDALDDVVNQLKGGVTEIRVMGGEKGKVVSVPMKPSDRATLLNAIGNTIAKLIPLERQAHGIEGGGDNELSNTLKQLMEGITGATRGLPNRTQRKIRE